MEDYERLISKPLKRGDPYIHTRKFHFEGLNYTNYYGKHEWVVSEIDHTMTVSGGVPAKTRQSSTHLITGVSLLNLMNLITVNTQHQKVNGVLEP